MLIYRESPKSINIQFDTLSAVENINIRTSCNETKMSDHHAFVLKNGKLRHVIAFNF